MQLYPQMNSIVMTWLHRFPFIRDNLKVILRRLLKFCVWVYIHGNASGPIVLWPLSSTITPIAGFCHVISEDTQCGFDALFLF